MLRLNLEGGKPIFVNIDHIVTVDVSPSNCAIITTTKGLIYTADSADAVFEWINEAKGLTA